MARGVDLAKHLEALPTETVCRLSWLCALTAAQAGNHQPEFARLLLAICADIACRAVGQGPARRS
jgi:hypothetical protein